AQRKFAFSYTLVRCELIFVRLLGPGALTVHHKPLVWFSDQSGADQPSRQQSRDREGAPAESNGRKISSAPAPSRSRLCYERDGFSSVAFARIGGFHEGEDLDRLLG